MTPENFSELLTWLRVNFWEVVSQNIENSCREFYEAKTRSRVGLMLSRLSEPAYRIRSVDGVDVSGWESYFDNINWADLAANTTVSLMHGDLQFDNVIFDADSSKFTLIDWRNTFGAETILGDLYYDFAKLLGGGFGLITNLSRRINLAYRTSAEPSPLISPQPQTRRNSRQFFATKRKLWG